MKMLPRVMASLLLASAGFAFADAGPDQLPPPPPMKGKLAHPPRGEARPLAGPLAGLIRLKPELKLSAAQEAKWAAAESASKAAFEARGAVQDQLRSSLDAERQKDVMDLAKLDKDLRAAHEQGEAAHEAARDKWLAVYDSLSAEQKRLVSDRMKQQLARADERPGHGAHRKHGRAPMPQPEG